MTRSTKDRETEQLKKQLRTKARRRQEPVPTKEMLGTGSALLNLACSDRIQGGFSKGKFFFLVGDSASGKTFLSLTCLAEASINKAFDDYRFIYDNAEDGALMDIERFFGAKVAERIEPPGHDDAGPVFSSTIEEFYYNVDDAFEQGRPFIYILDSMDVLSSESEGSKFDEQKTAHRRGRETVGSYGDGKAKQNSSKLRVLVSKLKKNGSILIILNQTRDNLGFGFEKKSRSGGRALTFYATLEIWSSIKRKLSKVVKGQKRTIGVEVELKIKKNRYTGKLRSVTIPIYYSYGIDDVGSCVDYLVSEKRWAGTAKSIKAPDLDFVGSRDALIRYIEDNGMEKDLKLIVSEVWAEVEAACALQRKQRY